MTLTKKNFIQWLEVKRDEFVGFTNDAYNCPIATYYKQEIGADDADVAGGTVIYEKNCRSYEKQLPLWARNFVENVDDSGALTLDGEDALEIIGGKHG